MMDMEAREAADNLHCRRIDVFDIFVLHQRQRFGGLEVSRVQRELDVR